MNAKAALTGARRQDKGRQAKASTDILRSVSMMSFNARRNVCAVKHVMLFEVYDSIILTNL